MGIHQQVIAEAFQEGNVCRMLLGQYLLISALLAVALTMRCDGEDNGACEAYGNSVCYQPAFEVTCCNMCNRHRTGIAGCEFGNKADWCSDYSYSECENDDYLQDMCCGLCNGVEGGDNGGGNDNGGGSDNGNGNGDDNNGNDNGNGGGVEDCGRSKYSDAGRPYLGTFMIGGQTSRPHEFPWTVSIRWAGQTHIWAHTCVGVLVARDWVMTAAHCVYGTPLSAYVAVVGTHNIFETQQSNAYRQELEIEDWFWFPDMAKDSWYEGDIAMIKLKTKAELNGNVQVICMPEGQKDYAGDTGIVAEGQKDYAGDSGIVAGWGEQTYAEGDYSHDLKYIAPKILTSEACLEYSTSYT